MDSDEDEEVIFKGSHLHNHLLNSEYSGPDIEYYTSGNASSHLKEIDTARSFSWKAFLPFLSSKLNLEKESHELEFTSEIIQYILGSSLVSLEDADFLSNMIGDVISNSDIKKSANSYFGLTTIGGAALSVALLSTPDLPWTLQAPSLLFIGWNVLLAMIQKISDRKRERLNSISNSFQTSLRLMQGLCSTMSKAMQFIQEMELIDRGFTLPNLVTHLSLKTLPNQPSALLCLPLRQELMDCVRHLHRLARDRTLRIREDVPLNSAVDNSSHYMACQIVATQDSAVNDQQITLPTLRTCMRECQLQISEMLRRLALCFLLPAGSKHFQLMEQINREIPDWVSMLGHRLQTTYNYFTAWKVNDSTGLDDQVSPVRKGSSNLDLALHSLERHLKATALIVEAVREPGEILSASSARVQLNHECRAISTCWELVELELEKMSNPNPQTEIQQQPMERNFPRTENPQSVQPLYGAWEPDVQDLEILEADLENIPSEMTAAEDDYDDLLFRETREERLARKREMAAQSKRLYSELQVVLRSKAVEWAEREAKVMERMGRTVDPTPSEQPEVPLEKVEEKEKEPQKVPLRFDVSPSSASNFTLQASLAAQVRALASQRTVQHEDMIGDDSEEDPSS